MKNLIIPIDHLVMLAELDDKDAGLMAKAIVQYANKGIAPSFSNSALKAIFTLFRSIFCKTQRNQYDQCHGQEVGCKEEGCQESNCN